MNTYPKYKDSGEQWLGQIPEHWEMKRLMSCFSQRTDRYQRGESLGILSLLKDVGIVPYEEKGNIGNTAKNDVTQYKVARQGDLVINSMNVIIGSLGITPIDGYISPAYYAFQPRENVCTRYYNYILSLRRAQQNIRRFAKGIMEIRLKISANDFLSIQYPVPPLAEQEAMVAYLDEQTGKIDAAIEREQKMIDLLEERKQIIIQQAVTKGLNPNAPMKDSGIVGNFIVPEHWRVTKTLYALSMPITDGPHETPDLYEVGIPFVSAEAVSCGNGKIDFDHIRGFISESFYKECCKKYIPALHDIYMIKSGATTGKVAIVDTDRKFTIWSPLAVFRCNPDMMTYQYMFYLLQSDFYQKQVQLGWSYGTQQNIGMRTLEKLRILLPPIDEQLAIASYLDNKLISIDKAIAAKNRVITLLQERKQIIINEVVTGKIKVS